LQSADYLESLETDALISRRLLAYLAVACARNFRVLIHRDLDIVTLVKQLSARSVIICAVSVSLLGLYLAVWFSFAHSSAAKRSDFIIYYSAGRLPLSKLYDVDANREVQTTVAGSLLPVVGGAMPFNHTPVFVPLLHVLVDDDYAASYLRWTALLWLAALTCSVLVYRITGDVALALAAFSFYPLFTYIQQAHDTVFLLLGILLGAHLLSLGRDFLAGLALSLAMLKPHFAIFLAVPLIVRPRAFTGFCVASIVLALYSVLLVGAQGVSNFVTLLRISAGGVGFGVHPLLMLNLLGLMERMGVSPDVARPVAWVVFFLSAVFLLAVWKRSPLNPPFALTVLLAVFTSPHLYGHDLALLLVSFATLRKPYPLFLVVTSLALVVLNISSLNISPSKWQFAAAYILMGALMAMSIKDLRRSNTHPSRVASNL
jgi:hypothetical protein